MKTCPKCGAPQADGLPKCDLCGALFPGETITVKPRFEKRVLIALISDILAIIAALVFFYFIDLDSYYYNSFSQVVYHIIVFGTAFLIAAGPISGLIFAIVGLKKTKSHKTKGKILAIAEIVISSLMLPVAIFFVILIALAIFS